ncbi:MAG: acetolactate synthase small subunit [Candidatus Tectomicrobia bacterium]|nr:acetolactate synthase small subunit [Candidatus Tectomicrobia bacterium]
MRRLLSIKVRNHPGVLSHVAGLFTRRAFNIESIAAGPTEDPSITRIHLVAQGDEQQLDQVTKQIRKLIDVLEVEPLSYAGAVTRELVLITVYSTYDNRRDILLLCDSLGARVVDLSSKAVTIEFAGNERQVNNAVRMMERFGIKQMARTGMIALPFESILEEGRETMS